MQKICDQGNIESIQNNVERSLDQAIAAVLLDCLPIVRVTNKKLPYEVEVPQNTNIVANDKDDSTSTNPSSKDMPELNDTCQHIIDLMNIKGTFRKMCYDDKVLRAAFFNGNNVDVSAIASVLANV